MILSPFLAATYHLISCLKGAPGLLSDQGHIACLNSVLDHTVCVVPRLERDNTCSLGYCTITLAVSQCRCWSSAWCSFAEVPMGIPVESFQWFRVIH